MVTFERVGKEADPILRNLYQLYVHDMSEWFGMEARADGRFDFDTDPLWQDDVAVYLARWERSLTGFGVVVSVGAAGLTTVCSAVPPWSVAPILLESPL